MNIVPPKIINFIRQLDSKELIRLTSGILIAIVLFSAIVLFGYYKNVNKLKKRMKAVNQQRAEAQSLLERYARVVAQKKAVEELLKEDSSFKIKSFFGSALQELNLTGFLAGNPDVAPPQALVDGYIEIKLDAKLQKIDMKQLVELLENIEKNERVYVKELKISKSNGLLQANLTIATFEVATAE